MVQSRVLSGGLTYGQIETLSRALGKFGALKNEKHNGLKVENRKKFLLSPLEDYFLSESDFSTVNTQGAGILNPPLRVFLSNLKQKLVAHRL